MRIHLSPKPLEKVRSVKQLNKHFKPSGLWYGIDDAWIDWVSSEMPNWLHELKYEVELSPSASLLVLSSAREIIDFTRKFHDEALRQIDWSRVAKEYDGIEINPYEKWGVLNDGDNELGWSLMMWYSAWDCSSGCVWNSKAINSVRKV